jgi:hypothetical protein
MTTTLTKFATYEDASGFLIDRKAENLAAVRNAIFALFETAGIDTVTVEFDGSGDEGQITGIEIAGPTNELPAENIEVRRTTIEFEYEEETVRLAVKSYNVVSIIRPENPRALLEELCFDLLNVKHCYWGDGEGAYGDIKFENDSRTITVDFNERFVDSTNHNYEI